MKLCICAGFLLLFLHSSSGFWGRRRRRRSPPPAPKGCASLNAPYNGWIGSSSRGHGATVSVHCNQGYRLYGNGRIKCTDGVWSPSLPTCVDVNECKSATHDCSNSAQCVNIDGGFQCKCYTGYDLYNNGKACTQRCPAGCVHGSCRMTKASNGPALPEYKCNCMPKWSSTSCNQAICSQGCTNGQCLRPDDCSCHDGWTGASCNIAICSRGCKHGTCHSPETCFCQTGWAGETCDEPICSKKCENGGVCEAPDTCNCKETDWEGDTCSKPVCKNTCQNGGTCVAPSTCDCVDGYTGSQCEIKKCKDIDAPDNGLVTCSTFNKQQVCNIFCSDAYDFSHDPDNPFVCGVNGKWSHEERLVPVPECIEADPLGIFMTVESKFEYPGDCESLSPEERSKISSMTFQSLLERLCPCNEITITNSEEVECGAGAGRRRRQVGGKISSVAIVVKFRLEASKDSRRILNSKFCNSTCRAAAGKLVGAVRAAAAKLVTSVEEDPLSVEINGVTLKSSDVTTSKIQASCNNPGQIKIGTRCFMCSKGNHIREGKCEPCPLHTYQDAEGKTECISCPNRTQTLWKGSKSLEKCLRPCQRGTYSYNGLHPCTPCSMHSYQPEEGQMSCLTCPDGTKTTAEGASNESMCGRPCQRGTYSDNGMHPCAPCPTHLYQPEEGQTSCLTCPDGTITTAEGASNESMCVRECLHGTYSDNGLHPCTPCPTHLYQPEEGQTSCLTCPNGTITTAEGASDESMCIPNCTNNCIYGFRCDGCRCISRYKVCDLTQDCFDGSDEQHCDSCDGFFCLADFLLYQRICTSSFAAVAEIKEVVSMGDDKTMMECDVKEVLYSANSTNVTSVNDGHFYLGSKAVACHCPSVQASMVEAGNQYMLTGHKNQDGALIVSHHGIFKPWRNDTQSEISEAISLVKNGNCSLTYG